MIDQIFKIFKKEYQTLNRIGISRENLLNNYLYLCSINKGVKIAPVLKSNAYGHGEVVVARILDNVGAPFFCVDSLYEAYELLKVGIKTPILIMGYTDPQNLKVKKLPFSFAIFDLETVKVLNEYQPGCGVHIFVDTGMHREGVSIEDLPNFLTAIKQFNPLRDFRRRRREASPLRREASNLTIEGLMSHLASADDKKDPLNKLQIKNFKKALQICQKYGIKPKWSHLSNSDGLLNLPDVSIQHTPGVGNLARVGLALYGISHNPNLKPALTLKTKIIQIKKLNKGDSVGYGGTFIAKKSIILGILPLGYYDGVDRRLSNKGFVTVDGTVCPIIGRVSMNITTIDITKISNQYVGQEVLVYSGNPKDKNSIENVAKLCKTIPYDILVHLSETTKRIVV